MSYQAQITTTYLLQFLAVAGILMAGALFRISVDSGHVGFMIVNLASAIGCGAVFIVCQVLRMLMQGRDE